MTDGEFAQFVRIAIRSASELEYHLLLAHDRRMMKKEAYEPLTSEVTQLRRMLGALLKKLGPDS